MMRKNNPGDVLLSHQATLAVPSALEDLTAVFGMGTGVTPPLRSPGSELKIPTTERFRSPRSKGVRPVRPPKKAQRGTNKINVMVKPHDRLVPVS